MADNNVALHAILTRATGLLALMRPRQWVKNGFVVAPLVFSGSFLDMGAIRDCLLAVFLFCIASSATYVVNDISDIERDRRHEKKSKSRPLASGAVSISHAIALLIGLYAALISSWWIAPSVVTVITSYLLINVAYTFVLKHQPVADIFTIAVGFVLRVYAGALAINVPVSSWMFITTLCLALYLAAVKRRQELSISGTHGREVLQKYSVDLMNRYAEVSATGALLFYSMFVMSAKPELVVTVPLVIFGLFRYWYAVDAHDGGESPTDVLLTDWQLLLTLLLWILVCGWSLWPA